MKDLDIRSCIFGLNFYNEQNIKYLWVSKNSFAQKEIAKLKDYAINELKIPLEVAKFLWPTLFYEIVPDDTDVYMLVRIGNISQACIY